jgi:hypothetical protein
MVTVPAELEQLSKALALEGLPFSSEKAAQQLVSRLQLLAQLFERSDSHEVVMAVAFGSAILWLKQRTHRTPLGNRETEILIIVSSDRFSANERLSRDVFGPILLKKDWLPRYHLWTENDLQAAKKNRHPLWLRANKEGLILFTVHVSKNGR